jgi:uncharacterized protein YcaQ
MARRIRLAQARRIALAAQGFARPRPGGSIDVRHFRRVLDHTRIVQLDSVNVVARAHYLPFFSRLGAYDREKLDRWLWRSRELFEYWVHEASLAPLEHRPLLAHRMTGGWHWPSVERMLERHPEFVEEVLESIRASGPVRVGDLDRNERSGSWWGWSDAKLALEYLFLTGRVTTTDRPGFQRVYDLPERVHPGVLDEQVVPEEEAHVELMRLAATAYGVGTVHDLADYYRIKIGPARVALERLLAEGAVEEVQVEGWRPPAYVPADLTIPRRVDARALLAPFDPMVWFRDRAERLFDFHYRIEIYVPAPKRVFGYYVLPFLLGDQLVARVDLKADRKAGALLARGVFAEPDTDRDLVARNLWTELCELAGWLGLGDVVVGENGDLVEPLRMVSN